MGTKRRKPSHVGTGHTGDRPLPNVEPEPEHYVIKDGIRYDVPKHEDAKDTEDFQEKLARGRAYAQAYYDLNGTLPPTREEIQNKPTETSTPLELLDWIDNALTTGSSMTRGNLAAMLLRKKLKEPDLSLSAYVDKVEQLLARQPAPNVAADLDGFRVQGAAWIKLVCGECHAPISNTYYGDDLGQLARRALAHECPEGTEATPRTSDNSHTVPPGTNTGGTA